MTFQTPREVPASPFDGNPVRSPTVALLMAEADRHNYETMPFTYIPGRPSPSCDRVRFTYFRHLHEVMLCREIRWAGVVHVQSFFVPCEAFMRDTLIPEETVFSEMMMLVVPIFNRRITHWIEQSGTFSVVLPTPTSTIAPNQ